MTTEFDDPEEQYSPIADSPALLEFLKAREFHETLQETHEKITDTDFDLSADQPYLHTQLYETLEVFGPGLIEEIEDTSVHYLSEEQYLSYIVTITDAYRQVALNTLIGIGAHYQTAKAIAEEMGPDRDVLLEDMDEAIQAMLDGNTFFVFDPNAIGRTFLINLLTELRTSVHECWTGMFNGKGDRMLAKRYLLGKIDENQLREEFSKLKPPEVEPNSGIYPDIEDVAP